MTKKATVLLLKRQSWRDRTQYDGDLYYMSLSRDHNKCSAHGDAHRWKPVDAGWYDDSVPKCNGTTYALNMERSFEKLWENRDEPDQFHKVFYAVPMEIFW